MNNGCNTEPQTYNHTNEVVLIVSCVNPCVDIVIWICSNGFNATVKIVPRALGYVFDIVETISSFLIPITLV